MAEKKGRFSRRATALIWLAIVALVIALLIGFEQIAILYVLATVALVVLLGIVAMSDLEKVGVEELE